MLMLNIQMQAVELQTFDGGLGVTALDLLERRAMKHPSSKSEVEVLHDILFAFDLAAQHLTNEEGPAELLGEHSIVHLNDREKYIRDILLYINKMGEGLDLVSEDYLYFSEYCPTMLGSQNEKITQDFLTTKSMRTNVTLVYSWIFVYALLALVSILSSWIVYYTIANNKNLSQHPNMLIAYLSIASIMSCWALFIYIIGTPEFVCYFGIAELLRFWVNLALDYTPLYFIGWTFDILKSVKVLCFFNQLLFEVGQIGAIGLSACTCIDLLISFKNPFQQGKYRMKWYLLGSALIVLVIGPNSQSVTISPDMIFDTYMLPFLYKDPTYRSKFKQKDQLFDSFIARVNCTEVLKGLKDSQSFVQLLENTYWDSVKNSMGANETYDP